MPEWIDITTTQDSAEGKRRFLDMNTQQEMTIEHCPYVCESRWLDPEYQCGPMGPGPICYKSKCPHNYLGRCNAAL